MVFAVGECLRRSYDNRLACVDAKRVEILHIADCNTVVIRVANNFVLNLFPPFQALLHQNLRRKRECLFTQRIQFHSIIAEAGAETAQRVRRTDNYRVS